MEWTREVKAESDEERERRPKKAKRERERKPDPVSGDEGLTSEPTKKKRRGKLAKRSSDHGDNEEEAPVFSDDEGTDKPAKKVNQFID